MYKTEIKEMARSLIELQEELKGKKKEVLQESRKSSKSKSKSIEVAKQEK